MIANTRGGQGKARHIGLRPVALCVLMVGCGGDAVSRPSDTPPNVAGTYTGLVSFVSASPSNHCFSNGLARIGGHVFRYTVIVQQAGSQLSGVLNNTDMGITCSFTGTVTADGLMTWSQTSCADAEASFGWSSESGSLCSLRVAQTGHAFRGRGRLSGDLTLDWSSADADSGADLGALRVQVAVSLDPS